MKKRRVGRYRALSEVKKQRRVDELTLSKAEPLDKRTGLVLLATRYNEILNRPQMKRRGSAIEMTP